MRSKKVVIVPIVSHGSAAAQHHQAALLPMRVYQRYQSWKFDRNPPFHPRSLWC
jgi:hypothetical protein